MPDNHPTVLMLEDDVQLGSVIKESLELKKYKVDWVKHSEKALLMVKNGGYDICLVDIGLPGMSGTEFVKEVRKTDYNIPILFMSGNSEDNDKIHAFCVGGDDFISKPFSTTELSLRIYALLRRTNPKKADQKHPDLISFGNFTFDYPNRLLCSPSGDFNLTKKEAEVLRMLAQNMNNVVKREQVLTSVWGENDYFMGRSMDVYIARLRKKLQEDQSVSIVNVHRMGFKLEVKNGATA
ncbi:MAG: response regulator transcription factor [Bacteroidales bacterium]|nr:response regulator transcription factor [Bacteroidales bacterium]MDT8432092.1 response regulator transcription factor [Bacteroidales bacterium]